MYVTQKNVEDAKGRARCFHHPVNTPATLFICCWGWLTLKLLAVRSPGCRRTAQVSLSPAKGAVALLPCPLYQAPWHHPLLQLQQRVLQSKPTVFYRNFTLNTRCHWHTLNAVCWNPLHSACSAPHPNAEAFSVPAPHWKRPHKSSSGQVWGHPICVGTPFNALTAQTMCLLGKQQIPVFSQRQVLLHLYILIGLRQTCKYRKKTTGYPERKEIIAQLSYH